MLGNFYELKLNYIDADGIKNTFYLRFFLLKSISLVIAFAPILHPVSSVTGSSHKIQIPGSFGIVTTENL